MRRADPALSRELPLVLGRRAGGRRVVTAADAVAREQGLRSGMTVAEARILVPGVIVHEADPAGDAAALDRLALGLLERVTPLVAPDPPDGLVLDTTGADHLHGGEAQMLADLVDRLARSGVTARVAIADCLGAAHALARFGSGRVVLAPAGHGTGVLAALPPEALRIAPALAADLRLLGLACIGDLLAGPRAPLVRRFGLDLGLRLDQITGARPEPVEPVRAADPVAVRRAFDEPISAPDTIARHVEALVARFCRLLEERSLGARRVDLVCRRLDNRLQAVRIGLAQPGRDPARLMRLLRERLETIDPGFGIEEMTLAASVAEPLDVRQTVNDLAGGPAPDLSALIDTLSNRAGVTAVYRAAPVPSDVPERSVTRIPALAPATGASWPAGWPRPIRLFARPVPIATVALLPDHPPVAFTFEGRRRQVVCADGPERIFGEWWKREAETSAVRDYFRVEDDTGARYWIFRAGDGEDADTGSQRWFLHGVFA